MSEKEKKELVDKILKLKEWLVNRLRAKNLLSYKYGLNFYIEDKIDGSYYIDLFLEDYRSHYDFGVNRKKFLESLVGEELEYFMEKYMGMKVRLEERHIERLFLLRRING